jgi:hypothetical protein
MVTMTMSAQEFVSNRNKRNEAEHLDGEADDILIFSSQLKGPGPEGDYP